MADVRRGRVGLVAVARFDRFARSLRHLVVALDEFSTRGIDFLTVGDAIDTSTAVGGPPAAATFRLLSVAR